MNYQNSEIHIAEFLLTQTGTYQEQHLRPFETNVTADHVGALERLTGGGRNIGIGNIQQVAGDVIKPSTTTEGQVGIANTWTSRRFRFMMRVIEKQPFQTNSRTQRVFFGYSDHCDMSHGNKLDPNMRIYFNSEAIVVDTTRNIPGRGPVHEANIVGQNQIITPMDMARTATPHFNTALGPTNFLIRPEDVYLYGQTTEIARKFQQSGALNGRIDETFNAPSFVGEGAIYKYSRRADNSPSRYLYDTLAAYGNAIRETTMTGYEEDRELMLGNAHSFAANDDIHANTFFGALKQGAGYMEQGYITLRDLYALFPEGPQNTRYSLDDAQSVRKVNHAHQSHHWHGSHNIDIAAYSLAQVIPAAMMDNYIRAIQFSATNGPGREFIIDVNVPGLRMVVDGLQSRDKVMNFQHRMVVDALNTITRGNQMGFTLRIDADLAGDTVIDISLDGQPEVRYVAPTFSDALFSPLITQAKDRYDHIANDLTALVENSMTYRPNSQASGPMYHMGGPSPAPSHYQPATTGASDDDFKLL